MFAEHSRLQNIFCHAHLHLTSQGIGTSEMKALKLPLVASRINQRFQEQKIKVSDSQICVCL